MRKRKEVQKQDASSCRRHSREEGSSSPWGKLNKQQRGRDSVVDEIEAVVTHKSRRDDQRYTQHQGHRKMVASRTTEEKNPCCSDQERNEKRGVGVRGHEGISGCLWGKRPSLSKGLAGRDSETKGRDQFRSRQCRNHLKKGGGTYKGREKEADELFESSIERDPGEKKHFSLVRPALYWSRPREKLFPPSLDNPHD